MCGYFCSKSSITASVRSWRSCDPHQAMRKVTCSCARALIAAAATKRAASVKAAQNFRMVNDRSSENELYDLPRETNHVECETLERSSPPVSSKSWNRFQDPR